MTPVVLLGVRLLGWRYDPLAGRPDPRARDRRPGITCPHCTNTDTLSVHCATPACTWLGCTCGALVYAGRRHRHPRHGSDVDTCHATATAA